MKKFDEMTLSDFDDFGLFDNKWFSDFQLDYLKNNTYYYDQFLSGDDYKYYEFRAKDKTKIATVETLDFCTPKIYDLDVTNYVNDMDTRNLISYHMKSIEEKLKKNINTVEKIIDNISVINSDFNYRLKKPITYAGYPSIQRYDGDDTVLFEFTGGRIELFTTVDQLEDRLKRPKPIRNLNGGAHLKEPYYYNEREYVCVGFYLYDYSLIKLIY